MITAARRASRGSALGVAVALALGACATPAPALVAAPAVRLTTCGKVTLADNPWIGYSANVAVISYLLRHRLGCTVALRSEGETDSWQHLAEGKVDAILENWGHDDFRKLYIDEKKVAVEAGLTGNKGVIGWYVPPWMATAYPDITDWRNLNTYADQFVTSKSNGKGQLLDGDPTYVTNDAALVKNLGLDYTVVYAGSESALIAAFRDAEKKHKPLLGYFYSPQWLLSEIKLVHISLPPYTPGCDADPKKVACDYQPYDLDKIENRKFAYSGSPAAQLIQNFEWTNNDQNQVAGDMTVRKMSADAAAKRWLDGHRSVWQKWLPQPAG